MITMQICDNCTNPFQVYQRRAQLQKLCPTCTDRQQGRPSVVLNRQALAIIDGVRVHSLPDEWEIFVANEQRDEPEWRMTVFGATYGEAWNGRIVIHARRPFAPGDVMRLRHMQAVHEVKAATWWKPTSPQTAFNGGPRAVQRRDTYPPHWADEMIAAQYDHPVVVSLETEVHEYIVLEPTTAAPDKALMWLEASTKHTFKGLGAQYAEKVEAPDAIWRMSVSGGLRSGRARTVGVLAVLPQGAVTTLSSTGLTGGGDPRPYTWQKEIIAE